MSGRYFIAPNRFDSRIPVDARTLKGAHVMIVPYEPIRHVPQVLTVPSVQLASWQAAQPAQ